jgi:hypothetical protein
MKHAVEPLRVPETTGETVTKFRQVTGQVLGADAMMDATALFLKFPQTERLLLHNSTRI